MNYLSLELWSQHLTQFVSTPRFYVPKPISKLSVNRHPSGYECLFGLNWDPKEGQWNRWCTLKNLSSDGLRNSFERRSCRIFLFTVTLLNLYRSVKFRSTIIWLVDSSSHYHHYWHSTRSSTLYPFVFENKVKVELVIEWLYKEYSFFMKLRVKISN